MHKIAFVVPTKDRPDDLHKLLSSVAAQTRLPDQLIVVDGSDPDVRRVVEAFPALKPDYVRVFPPSLSEQRNAGMKQLRPDMTLAGYLDDDLVLERDAIEKMLAFWESAPADFGGAAFNITNALPTGWKRLKRIFRIDSPVPGRMLRSGFPTSLGYEPANVESEWLYGGATVWRREVIDHYPYDEWFLGTGFMEDIDFSFSVRARYRLMLVANAKLAHYTRTIAVEKQYLLGKWQIVNRMYLVRKHRARGLTLTSAWVASIGLVLLNASYALIRGDAPHRLRARGNLAGIVSELLGRRERIGGILK